MKMHFRVAHIRLNGIITVLSPTTSSRRCLRRRRRRRHHRTPNAGSYNPLEANRSVAHRPAGRTLALAKRSSYLRADGRSGAAKSFDLWQSVDDSRPARIPLRERTLSEWPACFARRDRHRAALWLRRALELCLLASSSVRSRARPKSGVSRIFGRDDDVTSRTWSVETNEEKNERNRVARAFLKRQNTRIEILNLCVCVHM